MKAVEPPYSTALKVLTPSLMLKKLTQQKMHYSTSTVYKKNYIDNFILLFL